MKHLSLARLGIALAIPLMMAGCEAPEPNHANSDPANHAEEDSAGGGWCPLSALATCQAACDQVADCAGPLLFSEMAREACSFDCASGLMDADAEMERVVRCLSGITNQHACCEVTGCAASWLVSPPGPGEPPQGPGETSAPVPASEPAPPLPVALSGDRCPPEARFTTNGEGLAFCLFENIALPGPDLAVPYCHFVWDDYIGYHWPGSATPNGYECPQGFHSSDNPEGSLFCVHADLNVPNSPTLRPYCDFLEDGTLGYQWCLDPLSPACAPTPLAQPGDSQITPPTEREEDTTDSDSGQTSSEETEEEQSEPDVVDGIMISSAPMGTAEETSEPTGEGLAAPEAPEAEDDAQEDEVMAPETVGMEAPAADSIEATPGEEAQSELVEDLQEEDADGPLPAAVPPEAPEEDEEDLRCESMCERLAHCGGLEGSAITEVQACVNLCHTWGFSFQNKLFYCNLDNAETCHEVLGCWTPGGKGS